MKPVLVEKKKNTRYSTFAKVSVSKTNVMYINQKAVELLGDIEKNNLFVFKDEGDKPKWYLQLSPKGYISINKKNNKYGSCQVSLGDIGQQIKDSYGHEGKKALAFKVLEAVEYEGEKYFPLDLINDTLEFQMPKEKPYEFGKKTG
tara:strand:+ start:2900 stop:3337 length:438 start_codon:yes stop_codon:yes gene_type:complete